MARDMLRGFDRFTFTAEARGRVRSFDVYAAGEGPPLLVLQELPGLEAETEKLARRLMCDGFRVYLPHFLGPLGKFSLAGNTVRLLCLRHLFHVFTHDRSSPIVDWFRALVAEISRRESRQGVGVIGMCLTGNFALALMAEPEVVGAVASQPSFPGGPGRRLRESIGMSEDETAAAKQGMQRHGPAVAMRYADDRLCPAEKLDALEAAFAPDIILRTFDGDGHSLLTHDLNPDAYDLVRQYFRQRMGLA